MSLHLLPCEELTEERVEALYSLFQRCFSGVTAEDFRNDLESKGWVLCLEREDGAVRGFSTLDLFSWQHGAETVEIVYSGDTLVDPADRGSPELFVGWSGAVRRLRRHPERRLFWLLLTSGFRTYRFLPVFWRRFIPHHDGAAPPGHGSLLGELARERFGACFLPDSGVVRFPRPQVLRPELAGIPPGRQRDPHVAFFSRANPGHGLGDELACLAEVCESNLTVAGRRMWRAGNGLFPPP